MSVYVLLNLLIELSKRHKTRASRAFDLFYTTSIINSRLQEHKC